MRYIKLNIPVKTYVRKYIETKYPGPMKLTLSNYLGYLIFACLEKQKSNWHKQGAKHIHVRYNLLNDKLVVLLPADHKTLYTNGYSIPAAKSLLINNLFEEKINEDLFLMCNTYQRVGYSRRQAIEDFCDTHGIELDIDISYAALKKAEYRYRESLKKILKKTMANMSPPINHPKY